MSQNTQPRGDGSRCASAAVPAQRAEDDAVVINIFAKVLHLGGTVNRREGSLAQENLVCAPLLTITKARVTVIAVTGQAVIPRRQRLQ